MSKSGKMAVTGLSMICALGQSPAAITRKLLKGESGVKKFAFQAGAPAATVARVSSAIKTVTPNRWPISRATALALKTTEAILPRNGSPPPADPRLGLVHASAYGNLNSLLNYRADMRRFGLNRASPMQFPNTILHAAASFLSVSIGASAFNISLSNEGLSGMDALETAHQLIEAGAADRVVVVTSEGLSQELLPILETTDDLDWQVPAPFGAKRAGYVPGEAAVAMIVEAAAREQSSGANVRALLLGRSGVSHGNQTAATYMAAMQAALEDARISAAEVGCIMASANGSKCDDIEARAISATFGDLVPVTSVKAAFGECAASSSLLSIAAAIYCSEKGYCPPTSGRAGYDRKLEPINLLHKKVKVTKPYFLVNAFSAHGSGSQVWRLPPPGRA